ncbi:hypothetical protein QAD02_024342 [Eretmocerus hayati]|uniref:Uncharacterized protein n=1 Tax=Eretmocerus hayati TaxID=131215 RepID=A0ACC2PYT1_9HYME|nr:hypothetical protein QAD02_024342 [Eretmocerus hayati]
MSVRNDLSCAGYTLSTRETKKEADGQQYLRNVYPDRAESTHVSTELVQQKFRDFVGSANSQIAYRLMLQARPAESETGYTSRLIVGSVIRIFIGALVYELGRSFCSYQKKCRRERRERGWNRRKIVSQLK